MKILEKIKDLTETRKYRKILGSLHKEALKNAKARYDERQINEHYAWIMTIKDIKALADGVENFKNQYFPRQKMITSNFKEIENILQNFMSIRDNIIIDIQHDIQQGIRHRKYNHLEKIVSCGKTVQFILYEENALEDNIISYLEFLPKEMTYDLLNNTAIIKAEKIKAINETNGKIDYKDEINSNIIMICPKLSH